MPLPDPLPIVPFTRPVRGEVALPGSKSITNRAMLLAALCDGPVTLKGALFSEDTRIMAEALRRLGFSVREDASAGSIRVVGQGGKIPAEAADLFVGNAGTAARFLTALCAAAPRGIFKIDGVPQMRKRPMKGLIDALCSLGAEIRCLGEQGFFPLEIRARGLKVQAGRPVDVDPAESSQMLSALLLVAPLAATEVIVRPTAKVRTTFVAITTAVMHHFGAQVGDATEGGRRPGYRIQPGRYFVAGPKDAATKSGIYQVEADATAASYFFALPLVARGQLTLKHITPDSLQGDVRFAEVLGPRAPAAGAGLSLRIESAGYVASYDGRGRRGVTQDFSDISDTFLTLAAIAPLLDGPTTIAGIGYTRRQETDRVAGMARELTRLGQKVEETEDSLVIHPRPLRPDQTIETYGDHRFAMSFAILGCHDLREDGRPWLAIKDPGCCAKTFPNFFEVLESLRLRSLKP